VGCVAIFFGDVLETVVMAATELIKRNAFGDNPGKTDNY
jgi:hypothetical protein